MEIVHEKGHIAVDMGELLTSYQSLINIDDLTTTAGKPCIFEIPKTLSRHYKMAYLPSAFSFGPLHFRKPGLEATQAIKFRFLEDILHRFKDPGAKLAELEREVYERLVEARQCYAKQVEEVLDDDFVKILVLDGCFIIKLFLKEYDQLMGEGSGPYETKIDTAYLLQCLYHDLILLENQIPWFVLELLSNLVYGGDCKLKLREGAIRFFSNMFSHDGLSVRHQLLEKERIEHILDLLRNCLFLSFLSDEKKGQPSYLLLLLNMLRNYLLFPLSVLEKLWEHLRGYQCSPLWKCLSEHLRSLTSLLLKFLQKLLIAPEAQVPELEVQVPSASRLKEAGVKFKRGRSLRLNIKFQEGVLEIPSLLIHDSTETIFRNLIAFEQCYRGCAPIVTSYAKLMDNLIDTVEDIDILRKNGIICNSLNPGDATKFFNSLYNGTYISHNHYADTYREVNRYCQRWWPRWRAFYIHNYFGKPWAIFSQIFALTILALTILQVT